MNAVIEIKEISIDCIIGVTQQERSQKQTLLISVELVVDATKAIQSDSVQDGVDYKRVYEQTITIVENSQYHLLETLGKKLLDTYLAEQGVSKAAVIITKPNRLPKAKGVSITMRGEK